MAQNETNKQQNAMAVDNKFALISASDLMGMELQPINYVVDNLLPQGLAILAAPPKYGKSWFVLDLCLSVANGDCFLGMSTNKGGTIYLALEDSKNRLQDRLCKLTNTPPPNFLMTTNAPTLGNNLIKLLSDYVTLYPATKLIVIDTLQKIRDCPKMRESAYGNDYNDISQLKTFADKYSICILLIHHLRKSNDDKDVFMRLSGTNGIMGSADTILTLSKDSRKDEKTTLSITGRDVEQNEYTLKFDLCKWQMVGNTEDYIEQREKEAYDNNPIVITIRELITPTRIWKGTANDLNKAILEKTGHTINENPNSNTLSVELKRLTKQFIKFDNIQYIAPRYVSNGARLHTFKYT